MNFAVIVSLYSFGTVNSRACDSNSVEGKETSNKIFNDNQIE